MQVRMFYFPTPLSIDIAIVDQRLRTRSNEQLNAETLSTNPKEVFLRPSDHFSDGSQYIFFTELQKQKLHNCSQFFDTIASNALHRIKLFSQ